MRVWLGHAHIVRNAVEHVVSGLSAARGGLEHPTVAHTKRGATEAPRKQVRVRLLSASGATPLVHKRSVFHKFLVRAVGGKLLEFSIYSTTKP